MPSSTTPPDSSEGVCSNCSAPLRPQDRFCPVCGFNRLVTPQRSPSVTPPNKLGQRQVVSSDSRLGEADRNLVMTKFGNVSDRRLQYQAKKGWISGGTQEDIPLRHVTSVTLTISRRPFVSIFFTIVAIAIMTNAANALGVVIGLLVLLVAVLHMWGSPTITVNTSGPGPRKSSGLPWEREEAKTFTQALRNQLFRDDDNRPDATPRWG